MKASVFVRPWGDHETAHIPPASCFEVVCPICDKSRWLFSLDWDAIMRCRRCGAELTMEEE
jgi:hypothetical protein